MSQTKLRKGTDEYVHQYLNDPIEWHIRLDEDGNPERVFWRALAMAKFHFGTLYGTSIFKSTDIEQPKKCPHGIPITDECMYCKYAAND